MKPPGRQFGGGRRLALLALSLALVLCGRQARAEVRADLRVTPTWFTGNFGGTTSTDIYFLPLSLTLSGTRNDFRATVPYISLRSDEIVAYIGGEVVPIASGSTSESGLGDVVVRDDFFLRTGGDRRSWIYATWRLKLPTADEARGLGSGELDQGPGIGFIKPLGSRWHILGEALYVVRGDPPGVDFRNTFWLSLGAEARLSDRNRFSFFLDWRESVIAGHDPAADLLLDYSHRLSDRIALRSFVTAGFTDRAEDYGVGAGIVLRGSENRRR